MNSSSLRRKLKNIFEDFAINFGETSNKQQEAKRGRELTRIFSTQQHQNEALNSPSIGCFASGNGNTHMQPVSLTWLAIHACTCHLKIAPTLCHLRPSLLPMCVARLTSEIQSHFVDVNGEMDITHRSHACFASMHGDMHLKSDLP